MDPDRINIHLPEGTTEFVVRHGEALPPNEPIQVDIAGTIDAPLRFLRSRANSAPPQFSQKDCNIVVNLEEGSIKLTVLEESKYGPRITGQLVTNPSIQKFQINTGGFSTPEAMADFLRLRKHHFSSEATYKEVFVALRAFTAKVNQDIAQIKDDRGAYEQKRIQVVEHNIPKSFKLKMPLYKGMPKTEFEVEFLVNKTLDVSLSSVDLAQKLDETREAEIERVIKEIEEKFPSVLIMYQ